MAIPLAEVLAKTSFAERLPEELRCRLAAMASRSSYGEGEALFREGESPKSLLVVITGEVDLNYGREVGQCLTLESVGPGAVIGGMALFEGEGYPVTAVARSRTECLALPKEGLMAVVDAEPALLRSLASALPSSWYHTIDLGDGLCTHGEYDCRPVLDEYPIPPSLEGKTAIDVGTADGFFAFEMERRGAERVVAIDIEKWLDFDWIPMARERLLESSPYRAAASCGPRFRLAKRALGSKVEHRICSVYDLSPEVLGIFDVAFCGSLLLHLQNPLKALCSIRSVTREVAIIDTMLDTELERRFPDRPCAAFGYRGVEADLGSECIYWRMNSRCLEEMLYHAGFSRISAQRSFDLPTGSRGNGSDRKSGPRLVSMAAHP